MINANDIPDKKYELGVWDCYQLAKWVHIQLFPDSKLFPEVDYPEPLNEETASVYLSAQIRKTCNRISTGSKTGDLVELDYYGKYSLGTLIYYENSVKVAVMASRGILCPLTMIANKIEGIWRLRNN